MIKYIFLLFMLVACSTTKEIPQCKHFFVEQYNEGMTYSSICICVRCNYIRECGW